MDSRSVVGTLGSQAQVEEEWGDARQLVRGRKGNRGAWGAVTPLHEGRKEGMRQAS